MNNEVEIGSEWVELSSGEIVKVVYKNSYGVTYEHESLTVTATIHWCLI